jgi:hypothetical protein
LSISHRIPWLLRTVRIAALPLAVGLPFVRGEALASASLDLSPHLLGAERSAIAAAGRRDGRVWVRISDTALKSVMALPLAQAVSARDFDIIEIEMKTDARVHAFSFHWLRTTPEGSAASAVIERPIHRDDQFHRYMIRLDRHPAWAGPIQWVGIGWMGSDASIEIEKAELKAMTVADWVKYQWLEIGAPESLTPLAVNVIPGLRLFDFPLTGVVAVACMAGIAAVASCRRGGRRRPLSASAGWSSREVASMGLAVLIGFWIVLDLRTVYSHLQTLDSERRHFFVRSEGERHFFELDDLPDFLEAVDRRLPDRAPVAFFSAMPHEFHARYRLYPRLVRARSSAAPFAVVFQDPAITFQSGRLVESGTPLAGRFEPLWRFGPAADVFQRVDG